MPLLRRFPLGRGGALVAVLAAAHLVGAAERRPFRLVREHRLALGVVRCSDPAGLAELAARRLAGEHVPVTRALTVDRDVQDRAAFLLVQRLLLTARAAEEVAAGGRLRGHRRGRDDARDERGRERGAAGRGRGPRYHLA